MDFMEKLTRKDFIKGVAFSGLALVALKYLSTGESFLKRYTKKGEGTISFRVSVLDPKNKI